MCIDTPKYLEILQNLVCLIELQNWVTEISFHVSGSPNNMINIRCSKRSTCWHRRTVRYQGINSHIDDKFRSYVCATALWKNNIIRGYCPELCVTIIFLHKNTVWYIVCCQRLHVDRAISLRWHDLFEITRPSKMERSHYCSRRSIEEMKWRRWVQSSRIIQKRLNSSQNLVLWRRIL